MKMGFGEVGQRFLVWFGGLCRGLLLRGIGGCGDLLVVMRREGCGTCLLWRTKFGVSRKQQPLVS
jgi:hypothetical protein